ncbi:MAG: Cephalosporin hydroxylase [Candidatus Aminicenantes bacterium]|nr:Cephalosporin hydroxylase [Candidatus Aminicenantes bacterium]
MKNKRLFVLAAILIVLGMILVRDRFAGTRSERERRVATEFFRQYHGRGIHRATYWYGVPVQQTPTDMWMIQQIIAELRPDFLIETGTEYPVFRDRVIPLIGDSVGPDTIRRISDVVQGKPALVLLDSDHRRDHVLRELKLYAQFVPVGGYMIVFDTDLNGHPVTPDFGPGPMEAVEEFLKADGRFVSDDSREKFMLTMCAKGYLKRIK